MNIGESPTRWGAAPERLGNSTRKWGHFFSHLGRNGHPPLVPSSLPSRENEGSAQGIPGVPPCVCCKCNLRVLFAPSPNTNVFVFGTTDAERGSGLRICPSQGVGAGTCRSEQPGVRCPNSHTPSGGIMKRATSVHGGYGGLSLRWLCLVLFLITSLFTSPAMARRINGGLAGGVLVPPAIAPSPV